MNPLLILRIQFVSPTLQKRIMLKIANCDCFLIFVQAKFGACQAPNPSCQIWPSEAANPKLRGRYLRSATKNSNLIRPIIKKTKLLETNRCMYTMNYVSCCVYMFPPKHSAISQSLPNVVKRSILKSPKKSSSHGKNCQFYTPQLLPLLPLLPPPAFLRRQHGADRDAPHCVASANGALQGVQDITPRGDG